MSELASSSLEHHPYSDFLNTVRELNTQERTGTLFVTTDDHHSVRIMFIQGEIVDCYYGHRRGIEALENLNNAPNCRYRFAEGLFVKGGSKNEQLPPTDALLVLLTRFGNDEGSITGTGSVRSHNVTLLTDAVKVVNEVFTYYVGPFATVLVRDALRLRPIRQPSDLLRLLEQLENELDTPVQRRQFRDVAQQKLQAKGFLQKTAA